MKSRKGIAQLTLLLYGGIAIGGAAAIWKLGSIIDVLLGNIGYIIVGVGVLAGIGILGLQVYQGRFEDQSWWTPAALVMILILFGTVGGAATAQYLTSYQVTTEVQVTQGLLGADKPGLESAKVVSVEKKAPGIFQGTDRSACLWDCDTSSVQVEYNCDGEIKKDTVSGTGTYTEKSTESFSGEGKQCEATFTPGSGMDGSEKTVYFTLTESSDK